MRNLFQFSINPLSVLKYIDELVCFLNGSEHSSLDHVTTFFGPFHYDSNPHGLCKSCTEEDCYVRFRPQAKARVKQLSRLLFFN